MRNCVQNKKICVTSVKIIQLNEWGCRDAQKIVETRSSLRNTIKYTSTIMRNPFAWVYVGRGYS